MRSSPHQARAIRFSARGDAEKPQIVAGERSAASDEVAASQPGSTDHLRVTGETAGVLRGDA